MSLIFRDEVGDEFYYVMEHFQRHKTMDGGGMVLTMNIVLSWGKGLDMHRELVLNTDNSVDYDV